MGVSEPIIKSKKIVSLKFCFTPASGGRAQRGERGLWLIKATKLSMSALNNKVKSF